VVLAPSGAGAAPAGPRCGRSRHPWADDSAGLVEYTDTVVDLICDRQDLVVLPSRSAASRHRLWQIGSRSRGSSWWRP
jgi:hypothetical protein